MEYTWRWFGPQDPITLEEIKQTGATGIVTALYHISPGEVWSMDEILYVKNLIEARGLRWSVVESLPVHGDIKKQTENYKHYIDNYKQTIRNLGACGITTVTYNFIPMLDWVRTDVSWTFRDASKALRFDMKAFAAFDLFILKRKDAEKDYADKIIAKAEEYYAGLSEQEKKRLEDTILLSLPGTGEKYEPKDLRTMLREYSPMERKTYQEHLFHFLREVVPVAEKSGVKLAIHADDPPFPLFGVPRIVSTKQDALDIIHAANSEYNGLALCTGSFGAGYFNDLNEITKELAPHINFAHLRNVTRDREGNFYEDKHLEGDINLYRVVKELVLEEKCRKERGKSDWQIPMRPDHGHQMLDDLDKKFYPGYSLYGRMRALAEIKGLETGIKNTLEEYKLHNKNQKDCYENVH